MAKQLSLWKFCFGFIILFCIFLEIKYSHMWNMIQTINSVMSRSVVLVLKSENTSDVTAKCSPKRHIMFLKTHKTASSTVQNVLFRYADKENLTLALPKGKPFSFNYPHRFHPSSVEDWKEDGKSFDVLCSHMRFNRQSVERVIRSNDTFYFSILRNPVTHVESAFSYYKPNCPPFRKAGSLEEFFNDPRKYYNPTNPNHYMARNYMWYDFGYDNSVNFSEGYFNSTIREIEENFDLILIADFFDESMVLLKEVLCWDIDDVVSFTVNSRKKTVVHPVNSNLSQSIIEWNSLDWKLYNHFNKTFWVKVEEVVGFARLEQELEVLREKRRRLHMECLTSDLVDKASIKDKLFKPYENGVPIMGYDLRSNLTKEERERCMQYFITELPYTALLYSRQYPDKPPK